MKCNPPGNRDPYPKEQEACIPYLKYETLLLRSKDHRLPGKNCSTEDYKIGLSDKQRVRHFSETEKHLAHSRISPFSCTAG